MKNLTSFFVVIFTVIILSYTNTAHSQVWEKCVARYNGPADSTDIAASMKYDNTSNNDIIMEDILKCGNNDIIDDDEKWYLWNVGNKKYVFYNWGFGKVLDANDGICNQSCNCNGFTSNTINGHPAAANDATQVWILEEQ